MTVVPVVGLAALGAGASASGHAEATMNSVCRSHVQDGRLPLWASGGFTSSRPRMPHVLGASGQIMAILWAQHDPLVSPPDPNRANKILWVSRVVSGPGSDLRISAQRMVGSRSVGSPVARVVNGEPGPSIIDLPAPGCWRLTLRWSGRIDTLDLRYAANR